MNAQQNANTNTINANATKNAFYMKDVLLHIPVEQITSAFPMEGNKSMYPKGIFNANKCVQALTKKLKIQTKIPMIEFKDAKDLYKKGIGYNYIYYKTDGKIVMTYDCMTILSFLSQYNFKPQLLDANSSIKNHTTMISWTKNNDSKNGNSKDNSLLQEQVVQQEVVQQEVVQQEVVQEQHIQEQPIQQEIVLEQPLQQEEQPVQEQLVQEQPIQEQSLQQEVAPKTRAKKTTAKTSTTKTSTAKTPTTKTRAKKSTASTMDSNISMNLSMTQPIATSENIKSDQQMALQTLKNNGRNNTQNSKQNKSQNKNQDNTVDEDCNDQLLDELAQTLNAAPNGIELDMDNISFTVM